MSDGPATPSATGARGSRALAWFLAANVLLEWGMQAAAMERVLRVGQTTARASDRALFLGWCAALFAGGAAVAWGVGRGVGRVLPAVAWRLPAILGAAGLAIAAELDLRAYAIVGLHLYSPSVNQALRNAEINRELHLTAAAGYVVLAVFAAACVAEWGLLRACDRLARRDFAGGRRPAWVIAGISAWCALALSLALDHGRLSSPTSPLGKSLPLFELGELAFGAHRKPPDFQIRYPLPGPGARDAPSPASITLPRTPSVLLVAVESLRADAYRDDLMPRLRRFAADHHCLVPAHHFSSSHRTEYGVFSLLYGLDAYHYGPFLPRAVPSFPLRVLKDHGYHLAGASASSLSRYNGAGFVASQLGDYREFLDPPAWQGDARVADWARAFVSAQKAPFFLFLFFNSTHVSYAYPPAFATHLPAASEDLRTLLREGESPALRGRIKNRYDNAVGYVDALLGTLLDAVAAAGTDKGLAIVVTGDHGEEFWDAGSAGGSGERDAGGGLFGHYAPRFDDVRVQVPLVLCLPGAPARDVALSSHTDVLATVFDWAGAPLGPDVTDGVSLLRPESDAALRVITGADFPADCDRVCLLDGGRKFTLAQEPDWLDRYAVLRVTDLDDHPVPTPPDAALVDLIARFNRRFGTFLTGY